MITAVLPMASLHEGDATIVKVAGQTVIVALIEGQYYAVAGTCSHAGHSLAGGRMQGFEISCPLHGARFDIRTGMCTRAPAQVGIQRFTVVLEGGKVCVDV